MYKLLIRPLLFLFSPERIHLFVAAILKTVQRYPFIRNMLKRMYLIEDIKLQREVFGLTFKNPVGLAAGFDKDAELIGAMESLGFGFVEIGTITPKGQPGNPKPRLFRLKEDMALVNRMGFNNEGVKRAIERLKARRREILVGGNIGKNKITPNEHALEDYKICLHELYPYVDYFVVNVSSPNTPDLRALQAREPLHHLLSSLQQEIKGKPEIKPLLLKIAPDLNEAELKDIVEIANSLGISGIIATNTTISREGLSSNDELISQIGAGGLSGKPLRARSNEVIRYLRKNLLKTIPIIGVGGIMNAEDAIEKLEAGASLVQVYTGFIYEGPSLIRKINKAIRKKLTDEMTSRIN